MISRLLARRLRKILGAHYVECLYMEPYGVPTWAARARARWESHRNIEWGRGPWLWLALWRAIREAKRTLGEEERCKACGQTLHP